MIEMMGLFVGFIGNAVGMLGSALILLFLPKVSSNHQSELTASRPSWRETARLLRGDRTLLGLATAVSMTSLAGIAIFQFKPIHMDELEASAVLIGLASTIPAVIELGGPLAGGILMWWARTGCMRLHW